QGKSSELPAWIAANIEDADLAALLARLPSLCGDADILDTARALFAEAPAEVELAIDELQQVVDVIQAACPGVRIYLDLCELEGYHYHTGIVFAAYGTGARQALANGRGGGAAPGHPRPARRRGAGGVWLLRPRTRFRGTALRPCAGGRERRCHPQTDCLTCLLCDLQGKKRCIAGHTVGRLNPRQVYRSAHPPCINLCP